MIFLEGFQVKIGSRTILQNIHFKQNKFQNTAIIGSAAAGKTTFAKSIMGALFATGKAQLPHHSQITYVGQQHLFTDYTHTRSNLYYQQRFQSFDESTTEKVAQYLQIDSSAHKNNFEKKWRSLLNIDTLLDKNLIHLSNGENKRVQLYKSILQKTEWIIFDQPFIGLDVETRTLLSTAMNALNEDGITYLLLISNTDLPQSVEQVYVLENGKLSDTIPVNQFIQNPAYYFSPQRKQWNSSLLELEEKIFPYKNFVSLHNVNIHYGDKYLLKNINFTVAPNTAYCVYGHNGAGKSTLLSLITADHPQAYSNDVYLFDRKRGTGESIWYIKKNIGYLSPELHLYFDANSTCYETIGSGFFDTIGLFRKLNDTQDQKIKQWLQLLDLEHLSDKRLSTCSTGEQVQILLARACIKTPALLILDEPCQGLDENQTQMINDLIDMIFEKSNMSVLYVTHYHHQIPKCISQFYQLVNGEGTHHQ